MVSSAGRPQGMLATHMRSVADGARRRSRWISRSSAAQAAALACGPVMSSSCDSLKSVVMRGCVSAEPSASGCGVSASAAVGQRAQALLLHAAAHAGQAFGDRACRREAIGLVMNRS
jgi:hypothetical protein